MTNVFTFVFSVAMGAIILLYMKKGKDEKFNPHLRRLEAVEALEGAVRHAADKGGTVHGGSAVSMISDMQAPQTLAGLDIQGHVVELCAKYDVRFIATMAVAETLAVWQETVRSAYARAGRPDLYKSDTVRFLPTQEGWSSTVSGMLASERIDVNILVGSFWSECLVVLESGNTAGCLQIGGTANVPQLPFMIATCDHVLLADELYAASAYITDDRVKKAAVVGQDVVKALLMTLMVLGCILATANVTWLKDIMVR